MEMAQSLSDEIYYADPEEVDEAKLKDWGLRCEGIEDEVAAATETLEQIQGLI